MTKYKANFLPAIKKYIAGEKVEVKEETFKPYIIRVTADTLNGRKGPGTSYEIVTKLYEGTALTIVAEKGNWLQAKMGYWIHKNYIEFVRYA